MQENCFFCSKSITFVKNLNAMKTATRKRKSSEPQRGKKLKGSYFSKGAYKELVDDPFSLRRGAPPSYL